MPNRLPNQPDLNEVVESLRVNPAGRWGLMPSRRPVAEAGAWFSFLPVMPLNLMGVVVVYGRIPGVEEMVSISATEQPPGLDPAAFLPYLLAEVRVRAVPDGGGGVVVTVANEGN